MSKLNANSIELGTRTTTQRNALSATAGEVIFNSDTDTMQLYDGTEWVNIKKSGQLTATGGSTSTVNGYTVHKFTSSGTFEVTDGIGDIEVLAVGGGGSEGGAPSGCHGGGGGGGGGVVRRWISGVGAGDKIGVTIGSGGSWRNNGGDTTFGATATDRYGFIIAKGGGAGGATLNANGADGGSGGGASRDNPGNNGGNGIQKDFGTGGMGNPGGDIGSTTVAGAGGGALAAGSPGSPGQPGLGGAGYLASDFQSGLYVGGGGNCQGETSTSNGRTAGQSNGAANTGAGGGASPGGGTRYSGGSGVLFVRYTN
jgi:hypothetical protein